MKFHGRVARLCGDEGRKGELEDHDSLHLPRLKLLLCYLKLISSLYYRRFVMIIVLFQHLTEINFPLRFISNTKQLLLSYKSLFRVSREIVINVLQINVVLLLQFMFCHFSPSVAKARFRSVIINENN
jgi:hypothetical protein